MSEAGALTPAQIAKAALRRLALARLEPTPENYAQAWAEETGGSATALPARARPPLERLASRLTDSPEARDGLLAPLMDGDWDEVARQVDRATESAAAQSQAWAQLIERLTRSLERGGKQWTLARKKDSLKRVLDSSRGDLQRLSHRLKQLVASWADGELPATTIEATAAPDGNLAPAAPPHTQPSRTSP